uniref:Uncharacterized protein n=1 Tax=Anopheles stephensi TaxID=30069 RepID=A0A182Y7N9_ANOST
MNESKHKHIHILASNTVYRLVFLHKRFAPTHTPIHTHTRRRKKMKCEQLKNF